ncbi:MAG: glycosyltransferase family 1 protein, partial [Chloroflexi bacterium]|nr:glycosyltransferase family 1 protein [Chloroflexota bacterium]
MNIRLVALGLGDDLQPGLALAQTLRRNGHSAELISTGRAQALADQFGVPHRSLDLDVHSLLSGKGGRRGLFGLGRPNPVMPEESVARVADALWEHVQGCDLIVAHLATTPLVAAMTEKLNLPLVTYALDPLSHTQSFAQPLFPDLPEWLPLRDLYNRGTYTVANRLLWSLFAEGVNTFRAEILELPPINPRHHQQQMDQTPLLYAVSEAIVPRPPD